MNRAEMDRIDVAAARAAHEEAAGEEPIPWDQASAALDLLGELGQDQGPAVLAQLRTRFDSVSPTLVKELAGERVQH